MIERAASHDSRAKVTCDVCGHVEEVPCGHEPQRGADRAQIREGQVLRKLYGRGWALVKNKLHCPSCEAKRKAQRHTKPTQAAETATQDDTMTASPSTAELRKATPAQRREIHQHLLTFYDAAAGRYRDDATDKVVADMIGGGCMPGWVAEIREADYGPTGSNEEIEAIRADVAGLLESADRDRAAAIAAVEAHYSGVISTARALEKRINAVCAAVGPKAARA